MEVCLAVLQRVDRRYGGGYLPVAIPFKDDFMRYVRFEKEKIHDEVLLIVRGGKACVTTVSEAKKLVWMREN